MARFEPESYSRYRIAYPSSVFEGLRSWIGSIDGTRGIRAVDLGAGTGFSARSMIRALPVSSVILVEPDPSMLEVARSTLADLPVDVEYRVGPAEAVGELASVDLVLAASSWHWMDPVSALGAIDRMLRPGGAVFILEYQFPKLETAPAVNEWVRREFNLKWRTEEQRPRGSLVELTEPVRQSCSFSQRGSIRVEHSQGFTLDEFAGVIRSQSRYLAFESRIPQSGREEERLRMMEQLRKEWGLREVIPGSYSLEGYWFVKRWG
jgi:ubiquinone/menaquinone biosynthesis C-methylase UbiE